MSLMEDILHQTQMNVYSKLISVKLSKNKSLEQIAEEMELSVQEVESLVAYLNLTQRG